MKHILITTGDIDGVGLEVACKALSKLGPQKNIIFFLFYHNESEIKYIDLLKKFNSQIFSDWPEKFSDNKNLILIKNSNNPALNVEIAAKICLKNPHNFALCTGPLSKPEIINAGFIDIGHTDILKRISGVQKLFMSFLGAHFNVALLTGHIPLSDVSKNLSVQDLETLVSLVHQLNLKLHLSHKPIGILGLNPHAGDCGLIGHEDKIIVDYVQKKSQINRVGPLVPDTAFIKESWNQFSFYIAIYHDQGLIPFKICHGFDSGVHLTLGLSFIRTSVDHGTAKNIFGKNIANSNSMLEAIKYAIHLL